MVHEAYEHLGGPDTKVMEECAELILAITKAQRFGWDNYHPEDTPDHTNAVTVCEEMEDVLIRCRELRAKLVDMGLVGSLVAPFRHLKEEPRVIPLEPGEGVAIKGEFGAFLVERARKECQYDAIVVTENAGCEIIPASGVTRGGYLVMVAKRKEAQSAEPQDSMAQPPAAD